MDGGSFSVARAKASASVSDAWMGCHDPDSDEDEGDVSFGA